MRLNTAYEPLFFCFFYSPGSHHPLLVRTKFYDLLSSEYSKFAPLGKVYLMEDTNARLGHLLNDRNVHGQLTTNSNQMHFLDFLQYSGLVILNLKFCIGDPSYEIIGKKCSIIDLGVTNAPETVNNFKIESMPIGVNSQTCHRALTTKISIRPPKIPTIEAARRSRVCYITLDEQDSLAKTVGCRIVANENSMSPDYFYFQNVYPSEDCNYRKTPQKFE